MDKKRLAYVSADLNQLDPDPDLDWPIFEAACQQLPLSVKLVKWDDPLVNWDAFDLALVRSPWNYSQRRDEFVNWAFQVEQKTKLLNPAVTIKENTDKTYLAKLAKEIPVIPTLYFPANRDFKNELMEVLSNHEALAIKPNIGAGASLAAKVSDLNAACTAISKIHDAGFIAMIQPYLKEVDGEGEVAIVIIDGEISHAVKKVPALTVGGHGDAQAATEVTPRMKNFVSKISQLVSNWDHLLYARVDVVPTQDGLLLMELELTEPTLFFEQSPDAAKKLGLRVLDRLASS